MLNVLETEAVRPPALKRLDPAWVDISNALLGRAVAFQTPDGVDGELVFVPPSARPAAALIQVSWGGHVFDLRVFQPAAVPALDVALRPGLPLSIWRLAVREAVSDWIALLDRQSGTPATVVKLVRDPPPAPLNLSLGMKLLQPSQALPRSLDITATEPAAWQWIADRLGRPHPQPVAVIDPVMTLSFRLRPVCVALRELRTMQIGDVVLLDEARSVAERLPLICVVGQSIIYGLQAYSDGASIRLKNTAIKELKVEHATTVNPRPSRTSPKAGDPASPDMPQGPDALDALDMWLQFEVGHTKMSLGEVRSLTPGQVLVATGDDSMHEVRVLCNARWIATGRLVAIGERLGVQVTDVAGVDAVVKDRVRIDSRADTDEPVPRLSEELGSGAPQSAAGPSEASSANQATGAPSDHPDATSN